MDLDENGVVQLLAAVVRLAAIDADRATGRHQDSAVALLQDWAIDAGSVYKRSPHGLRKRREGARSI